MVIFKALDITYAKIISPFANVYPIALGRRSVIKTFSLRLRMEDSYRT